MNIQEQISHIQAQIDIEHHLYISTLARLNNKIDDLRRMCEHTNVKYCPDASGNNDWTYYCIDCGKESKNLRK